MSGLLADSIQYLVTDGAAPVGADLKGADVVIVASATLLALATALTKALSAPAEAS